MRVLDLNCNQCGAPLEVPPSVKLVTCSFCNTRLRVTSGGPAVYTEVLDGIAADVKELKDHAELERLDREWRMRREELVTVRARGVSSVPSKGVAIVGMLVPVVFGVVWISMARSMGAPGFFPMFGVLFIVIALVQGFRLLNRAQVYENERSIYESRRRDLMSEL